MLVEDSEIRKKLPKEIQVEPLYPEGARLLLPKYRPPSFRIAAFFFAVLPLTLMFVVFAAMCFLSAFGAIELEEQAVSRWWFLPFGLFFAVAALGLSLAEAFTFFGHVVIEVDKDQLKCVKRVGPLYASNRCRLSAIERLNVPDRVSTFGSEPGGGGLVAELIDKDPIVLTRNYPTDWLWRVAGWLSEEISRIRSRSGENRIEAVSETTADRMQRPIDDRPAESDIQIEHVGDAFVLRVPPPGLLHFAGGAGAICGVAFIGMLLVIGILVFNLDLEGMVWFLIVPGLIGLLSLGVFLWAVNGAFRKTTVTVARNCVTVQQQAPFGSRRQEWSKEQVSSVDVGPSEISVGRTGDRRHLPELQIWSSEGECLSYFAGRDERELRWLVTLLNAHIHPGGRNGNASRRGNR